MKVCFIQLARNGDIVSALPMMHDQHVQGHDVSCMVYGEFAGMFEGVSYVRPIVRDSNVRDVDGSMLAAKKMGFDRIIDCQVDGNPRQPVPAMENFILTQYALGGYLDKMHSLPLVFDRREKAREEKYLRQFLPASNDRRPLLVYALHGHSSPFLQFAKFEAWLKANFAGSYRMLDIGRLPLARPYDLLAFIEKAAVMVSIDTLHIHLATATQTPTIVLSTGDREWYWSEPRRHWIGHTNYEKAMLPEGQKLIRDLLNSGDFEPGRCLRRPSEGKRERIWHVVDWHCPANEDNHRILNARRTWDALRDRDRHWEVVWHETHRHAKRTSRSELGDARALPYMKDVIGHAVARADPDGIVVWTNSDISIVPEAPDVIRRKLAAGPCCYSRRVDVVSGAQRLNRMDMAGWPAHVGADLFAFRASIWPQLREELPDLLLAAEGWDWVARRVFEKHNPAAQITPPICYHESHQPRWSDPGAIQNDPAQKHNRKLCREFAVANGLERALYAEGESPFLFKADYVL